ncbi:MAG: radical SAM protein, partial [Thermoproteota archaeon]
MSRDGPEWIVWLVNASCNLRCPYCYASRYLRERPLSTEEALRVVREASDAGVEYINFTGGEPLLRRDLFEIVEAALDGGIEVSIFSNLTLLGEEQARRIARLGLYVLTSLDGPPEVYEAAKGPGTWRRFLRGIELLKKHGVAFHINIPVSELNYARVGEAVKLAAELGASSISVIPAMPTGRALETGAYIRPSSFLEALRQAEEAARELGITVSVWCAPFVASLQWARHLSYGNCRSWS